MTLHEPDTLEAPTSEQVARIRAQGRRRRLRKWFWGGVAVAGLILGLMALPTAEVADRNEALHEQQATLAGVCDRAGPLPPELVKRCEQARRGETPTRGPSASGMMYLPPRAPATVTVPAPPQVTVTAPPPPPATLTATVTAPPSTVVVTPPTVTLTPRDSTPPPVTVTTTAPASAPPTETTTPAVETPTETATTTETPVSASTSTAARPVPVERKPLLRRLFIVRIG